MIKITQVLVQVCCSTVFVLQRVKKHLVIWHMFCLWILDQRVKTDTRVSRPTGATHSSFTRTSHPQRGTKLFYSRAECVSVCPRQTQPLRPL